MYSIHYRVVACLVAVFAIVFPGAASAQVRDTQREVLIAWLEQLIRTGEPGHATHDAGETLQLAVDDAIRRGDVEIERLAIRAASPLTARITAPVSSTNSLPSLEINTQAVLKLAHPLAYSARILASLDGGAFVEVREMRSGKGQGFRVDTGLTKAAGEPGFHSVRVQAHLTFGDPQREGTASWTEVRNLPPLFYAVYDVSAGTATDARTFVYAPATVSARELDPLLGDEPFAAWLSSVLSRSRSDKDSGPDWMSQYCSERTAEAGSRPVPTSVCSVVYFQARGQIGQIWFRTADVSITDAGVEWARTTPPRFEGFVIHGSAPESQRLSVLPLLLDTDQALRPIGDVSIAPDDIVVAPPNPKAGAPAAVAITVRNHGQGDLFKVSVRVVVAVSPTEAGTSRQFVVDVPAQGSAEIKLEVSFPQGYGFLFAHAMQFTEHSPFENWVPDPTPEDACAVRIVNLSAAPRGYVESLGDAGGCRVK